MIPNLQFETDIESKQREIFTKGISFEILSKESGVGNPEQDTLILSASQITETTPIEDEVIEGFDDVMIYSTVNSVGE